MNTNKLVSVLAVLSVSFVFFFAAVARADTFSTERVVVTRASIDTDALRREVDRRADAALDTDALVVVSSSRMGEVTTVSVTVDAPRLSQRDELRLEREITAALRSPRVVEAVRFFPTRAKR